MSVSVPRNSRRSAYQINLDGEGLDLIEAIDIRPFPGSEPPPDAIYDDFSTLGMGFSEDAQPGGYGWADGSNDGTPGPWGGVCTRVPGVAMPSGKITELDIQVPSTLYPFRSSVEFLGSLFFFGGRYPVAVSGGSNTVGTFTADFLSDNVAHQINAATVFNGQLAVFPYSGSTGSAGNLWTTTDGVTWTEHPTITGIKCNEVFWDTGGVGAQRFVYMPNYTSFRTCSGDITVIGNYSGAVTIGGADLVTAIVASAKHLYFTGPFGVADVDARGHAANLCPDFKKSYLISNGGACHIFDGDLYVNVGNTIRKIPLGGARIDVPEHLHPGANSANGSPIWGIAAQPSIDNNWQIWPFYNPVVGRSYIMYARFNGQRWEWHGSEGTYPGVITHTRVTSPTSGHSRLWVCTEGSGGNRIFWQSLAFSGNPYQDWLQGGSHRYATHSSMYVGHQWQRPATKVIPLGYNIESENVSSSSKLSVWRRNDKEVDSAGVPVYTRKAVAQSAPYASPRDFGNASYARVDFRFDFDGTETQPPILRGVRIEADVNVIQRVLRKYTALIQRPQITARGAKQRRKVNDVVRHLRSMQGINATPVTFIDEDGEEARVRMLPSMIEQKRRARNGHWEQIVTFVLETLNRRIRWNTGERWNNTDQWGAA